MYQANYYIKNFLVGKGFVVVQSDYRYFYFEQSESLVTALSEMPYWYRNNFALAWDG